MDKKEYELMVAFLEEVKAMIEQKLSQLKSETRDDPPGGGPPSVN